MRIGYARVSTLDQDLSLQLQALDRAGCERIFQDSGISGSKRDRPQLDKCLALLTAGDALVVWKLDRLARSLPHLVELLEGFKSQGIEFRSLTEAIDTTTPHGRMMFGVCAVFAEFERSLIQERTIAGLEAARQQGKIGGRLRTSPDKIEAVNDLRASGYQVRKACSVVGIGVSSYYRAINSNVVR